MPTLSLTTILCALVAAVIGVQTLRLHLADAEIASYKAAAKAEATKQAEVSQAATTKETAAQAQIQTVTKTVVQRIPVYVTAKTNAAFPEPVGLVRLYGESLGVSVATGLSDDAASGLGAADLAQVVIPNTRACIADQERLSALQAFDTARAPAGKKAFKWPWSKN